MSIAEGDEIALVKLRHGNSAAERTSQVWCAQVELSSGVLWSPVTSPPAAPRCRLLVRLHGQVLGYLRLDFIPGDCDPRVLDAAWKQWGASIRAHLRLDGFDATAGAPIPARQPSCSALLPAGPPTETVTVAVCTRDRPDDIATCLTGLRALSYPALEIVVVDNAPRDARTRDIVAAAMAQDHRISYVVEPVAGVSAARNRAIATATGEYIAFTDDDVFVDDEWVQGLMHGFRRAPDVGCVTGLVCTAQITNECEAYFDARTPSWSTRLAPELYPTSRPRRVDPLYPFSAGRFGTGANFAFRRKMIEEIGGFDVLLGAGTACRGGEDLDAFVRTILSGHQISYEPSAVVWHRHRADLPALRKQMYAYGVGLAAYLAKLCRRRETRREVLLRIPAAAMHIFRLHKATDSAGPHPAPRGTRATELAGYLFGAYHYQRSAIRARRSSRPRAGGS